MGDLAPIKWSELIEEPRWSAILEERYSPDQPRDPDGRFSNGGDDSDEDETPEGMAHMPVRSKKKKKKEKRYSPDQPRDADGRFGDGNGTTKQDEKISTTKTKSSSVSKTPTVYRDGKPASELRPLATPKNWIKQTDEDDSGRHFAVNCKGGQVQLTVLGGISSDNEPTDEQCQRVASTVADLHDKYDAAGKIPTVVIGSSDDTPEFADDGVLAFTESGDDMPGDAPRIEINAEAALVQRDDAGAGTLSPGFARVDADGQLEYTTTHEFGHVIDINSGMTGTAFEKQAFTRWNAGILMDSDGPSQLDSATAKKVGVSLYGASSPSEEFAEAFADWDRSDGATTSKATLMTQTLTKWPK